MLTKNTEWSLDRPTNLSSVFGHDSIKKLLYKYIKDDKFPNAIIFQGESGIGKTTFAKILAKHIVCSKKDEYGNPSLDDEESIAIDTETYNRRTFRINGGTEGSVNVFKDNSELYNFLESPWSVDRKVVLIEEFQGLSSAAKEALLIALEKPESDVHYIFTTTGVSGAKEKKVYETLASRAVVFNLPTPSQADVMRFLKTSLEDRNLWADLSKEFQFEGLKYIALNFQNYRRALHELQKCVEAQAFTTDEYTRLITGESAEDLNKYQAIKDILMQRKTQNVVSFVKEMTNESVQNDIRLMKKYVADCKFYELFRTVPDGNYYQNQNAQEILGKENAVNFLSYAVNRITLYSTKNDMILLICEALNFKSQSVERVNTTTSTSIPTKEEISIPGVQEVKKRRSLLE